MANGEAYEVKSPDVEATIVSEKQEVKWVKPFCLSYCCCNAFLLLWSTLFAYDGMTSLFSFTRCELSPGPLDIIKVEGELPSTIAFGSCAKQSRSQYVLDKVTEFEPDMFLFLGDNVYGDTIFPWVMNMKYNTYSCHESLQNLWSKGIFIYSNILNYLSHTAAQSTREAVMF